MIQHIKLAFNFAKIDFKERYVGTGLGQLWYILSPIITIFIYTVIFSDFMKMKLNILNNHYAYSIYLIPGLLAWTSFSTTIIRLNTSILDKANIIKKINIPVYIFFISITFTEFIVFIISMSFAIIFLFLIDHPITLNFLWLLPFMIMQTIFALSLGIIFSLLTVFFRDLKEAIPIILQLWFWVSPIIYLREILQNKFPILIDINPFYYYAMIFQDIFLYSRLPDNRVLITAFLLSLFISIIAIYLYKKMIFIIKDII